MITFVGIMVMFFSFVGIIFTLTILAPMLEFWVMPFIIFIAFMFFIYIISIVIKSGRHIKEETEKLNEKIKKSIKE